MYSFVPAALNSTHDCGIVVYCKYKKPPFTEECIVKENSAHFMTLDLPDRILYITTKDDTQDGIKVYDWDECLPVSPFHSTSDTFFPSDYCMINYVEHYKRFDVANRSNRLGSRPKRTKVICDSGGFQIMQGRVNFIETKNLAQFYNNNADMGVVLDIPLYRSVKDDVLIKTAKIQKKNTADLLQHIDNSVELINVAHGYDVDKFSRFIDIVTIPEIDRLCISGLYANNILAGISNFVQLVEKYKSHYKHFHILGVYNISAIAFFIYIAQKIYPDLLITSDASTPIQSARSGLYHLQREFNTPVERLIIGSKVNKLKKFNPYRLLNCSCPLCRLIKYMDVFSFLSTNKITRLIMYHNICEADRNFRSLCSMADSYEWNDYKVIVEDILKNHRDKDVIKRAFKFMDIYLDTGDVLKAEKIVGGTKYTGLFDSFTQHTLTSSAGETVTFDHVKYKQQVNDVIKKFETPGLKETFRILKKTQY